jgi:spore cortex formation protein SpoVR/YcgB (stage V sporulation)
MQQGSESKTAIEYCNTHGVKVISKQCILMFLQNAGFPHNFHHWIWGFGKTT